MKPRGMTDFTWNWLRHEVEPWRSMKLWTAFVVTWGAIGRLFAASGHDHGDETFGAWMTEYDWKTCGGRP